MSKGEEVATFSAQVYKCSRPGAAALTDVILVVNDGVEGHVLVREVPLRGLHIVGPLVGLYEALEAAVHHRAVGQSSLFT